MKMKYILPNLILLYCPRISSFTFCWFNRRIKFHWVQKSHRRESISTSPQKLIINQWLVTTKSKSLTSFQRTLHVLRFLCSSLLSSIIYNKTTFPAFLSCVHEIDKNLNRVQVKCIMYSMFIDRVSRPHLKPRTNLQNKITTLHEI